jgi:hypothetical protein
LIRRSITLNDYQVRGLGIVAAARDKTVQEIISAIVNACLTAEAEEDPMVAIALARMLTNPEPGH